MFRFSFYSLINSVQSRRIAAGRRNCETQHSGALSLKHPCNNNRCSQCARIGWVSRNMRTGTIVVRKHERLLYYVTGVGQAVRYPIGVGRIATQWTGATSSTAERADQSWIPPPNLRHDRPRLPPFIPGGLPENPMGVAAMTLSGGELSIHGTNEPNSVGHFVPYGCIRMFNEDIADLYRRVEKSGRP